MTRNKELQLQNNKTMQLQNKFRKIGRRPTLDDKNVIVSSREQPLATRQKLDIAHQRRTGTVPTTEYCTRSPVPAVLVF